MALIAAAAFGRCVGCEMRPKSRQLVDLLSKQQGEESKRSGPLGLRRTLRAGMDGSVKENGMKDSSNECTWRQTTSHSYAVSSEMSICSRVANLRQSARSLKKQGAVVRYDEAWGTCVRSCGGPAGPRRGRRRTGAGEEVAAYGGRRQVRATTRRGEGQEGPIGSACAREEPCGGAWMYE